MILYTKDPEESTRNIPHLINTFRKVAGFKYNTEKKNTQPFCTQIPRKKIRETIKFTIAFKSHGKKKSKAAKDLYNKSFKTLKKGHERLYQEIDWKIDGRSAHAHGLAGLIL